ncbi:MAG: cation diffusion facilitator family transporter [Bacteroidales bacterium]
MINKNRYGYVEGFISIVVNLLLFALKYWAGIVSGSLALIADAWHTLSDSASSVIVVGSVRLASKKADRAHPFGHGRYQEIAAIFIAFLLGIIAYEFMTSAIHKLQQHESTNFGTLAIVVTALSVLFKEGLAQYAYWAYRKTGFETLRADGWHHRSDALSSLVVLVGILLGNRIWWMDGALAAIISLLLFYAVFEIIKKSIDTLLGEQPDETLISQVKELIGQVSEDAIYPHHFHLHRYGDHKELTFHIRLRGTMDIASGHRIANEIESRLREQLGIEATIHLEPID